MDGQRSDGFVAGMSAAGRFNRCLRAMPRRAHRDQAWARIADELGDKLCGDAPHSWEDHEPGIDCPGCRLEVLMVVAAERGWTWLQRMAEQCPGRPRRGK